MSCGNCSPPLLDLAESGRGQMGVVCFKGDRAFLRGQSPQINSSTRVSVHTHLTGTYLVVFKALAHPASSCVWWWQKSTHSSIPSVSGCSSLRPQIRSYIDRHHVHVHVHVHKALYYTCTDVVYIIVLFF